MSVSQNATAILEIQKEEQFPMNTNALNHEKIDENGHSGHNYLFDCEPANLNLKIDNLPLISEDKDLKKA